MLENNFSFDFFIFLAIFESRLIDFDFAFSQICQFLVFGFWFYGPVANNG